VSRTTCRRQFIITVDLHIAVRSDCAHAYGQEIVLICVWTVVFLERHALGFASGLLPGYYSGHQPNEQTTSWMGTSWAVVPIILGPVGLILGILGLLPGTGSRPGGR
jgi:hypothetical protein